MVLNSATGYTLCPSALGRTAPGAILPQDWSKMAPMLKQELLTSNLKGLLVYIY